MVHGEDFVKYLYEMVSRMLKGEKYLTEVMCVGEGIRGSDDRVGLAVNYSKTKKQDNVYLVLLHEGVVKVRLAHRMEDVVWS